MDITLIEDGAVAFHLLGMALGFGVAITADISAARMVLRPLGEREVINLEAFHRIVTVGLFFLWVSGIALLWLRTGFDPANFTPKLLTKIGVVLLLTLNAIAIGRIGMPAIIAYEGRRFGELPITLRTQLASIGTISAACWISALALGVFSVLRPMPWETLSVLVGIVYLFALLAALAAALFTPIVAFMVRRFGRSYGDEAFRY